MPKTNSSGKPVRSFRLSQEGIYQLRAMASEMGRSESDVIEVALDRMYREEIRYKRILCEKNPQENQYQVSQKKSGENKDAQENS